MMHGERPIIGVTGPDRGGGAAWLFTRLAIALAGGCAVRITPRHRRGIKSLDGLVIGGGADVNPTLYGQELLHVTGRRKSDEPTSLYLLGLLLLPILWLARKASACCVWERTDPARDAMEMDLIHAAVKRRLPILGICRGEQLINIHFGGSLHQSLKGFYVEDPEVRTILPRKRILVLPGTRLYRLLGARPQRVNALHQQAIAKLGAGLRIAAKDRNQIVQAIEHATLPFVLGVQWHPEYLPQLPEQRAILRALVETASALQSARAETRNGVMPQLLPSSA